MTVVLVPAARCRRWVDNFAERHGGVELGVGGGVLSGAAPDGSAFTAALPFAAPYAGPAEVDAFVTSMTVPDAWGVLLVRKGGFAIARLEGRETTASKVGQRHVQGRTKAGGQSQQRFARRRDNQARQAYEAAADHAARILTSPVRALVTGGDHGAVEAVLEDPRLASLRDRVVPPWLAVPDPRRSALEQAVAEATSARFQVTNA